MTCVLTPAAPQLPWMITFDQKPVIYWLRFICIENSLLLKLNIYPHCIVRWRVSTYTRISNTFWRWSWPPTAIWQQEIVFACHNMNEEERGEGVRLKNKHDLYLMYRIYKSIRCLVLQYSCILGERLLWLPYSYGGNGFWIFSVSQATEQKTYHHKWQINHLKEILV